MTTKKWKTREVRIGALGVGKDNPVRIQSMTTSNTRDVEATVQQIKRLSDAGCEIARVTVQGKKEAEACGEIKNLLVKKGYDIPLVADIHFYPPAATAVVDFVDKVRINPGNFADKRASFKIVEYSDAQYKEELEKIEEKFSPLVLKCKKLKKALRIGTNHGSLSDRIMNRFGDTPRGMIESAFEYARICRKLDFHDIVFSMKSSNTKVMIAAYRLLVQEMLDLGWDYPIHLGVTEAGQGEDGRIKSSIGIGTLLSEGIGDTIRVSLTEDPWHEIDPCQRLVPLKGEYVKNTGFSREPVISRPFPLHPDGTVAKVDLQKHDLEGRSLKELSLKTKFSLKQTSVAVVSDENHWDLLPEVKPDLILLRPPKEGRLPFSRKFFSTLKESGIKTAVLLNFTYDGEWEDTVIRASLEAGSLLLDGLGQGLHLEGPYPDDDLNKLSLGILQGCRMRSSKTEFISCPSCGRTLFDLQQVSERIRQKTGHLPGVKVAIMGCIVNGPGEMADADFGYVGSKAGKVDLYLGRECVEKNIDMKEADDRLISLIKTHGRWVDP